jgi:hypothetical protein
MARGLGGEPRRQFVEHRAITRRAESVSSTSKKSSVVA